MTEAGQNDIVQTPVGGALMATGHLPVDGAASGDLNQFISFRVNKAEYGIDIMAVREIKGWTHVTALPNTPDFVRGVLNLRGLIVPIFDLKCRFGHGETEATAKHVVIIVALGDRTVGLLVDAVSDILTVSQGQIAPAPGVEKPGKSQFVRGLVTFDERMVTLLDFDSLFDLELDLDAEGLEPEAIEQQKN